MEATTRGSSRVFAHPSRPPQSVCAGPRTACRGYTLLGHLYSHLSIAPQRPRAQSRRPSSDFDQQRASFLSFLLSRSRYLDHPWLSLLRRSPLSSLCRLQRLLRLPSPHPATWFLKRAPLRMKRRCRLPLISLMTQTWSGVYHTERDSRSQPQTLQLMPQWHGRPVTFTDILQILNPTRLAPMLPPEKLAEAKQSYGPSFVHTNSTSRTTFLPPVAVGQKPAAAKPRPPSIAVKPAAFVPFDEGADPVIGATDVTLGLAQSATPKAPSNAPRSLDPNKSVADQQRNRACVSCKRVCSYAHRKKPQWPDFPKVDMQRNKNAPTDLIDIDLEQLVTTLSRASGTPLEVCYPELYHGTAPMRMPR